MLFRSVAMKNNRFFLGFEIREDYCNTIKKRLEQTKKEIQVEKATLKLF